MHCLPNVNSQLLFDGHQNFAVNLANSVKSKMVPPSERLHHLVAIALKAEGGLSYY